MDVLEDNLANLRVASFSCYLKPGDHETLVQKLNPSPKHFNDAQGNIKLRVKSPVQDLNADMFSSKTCPPDDLGRVSSCSNGEIGVFGADKYFNMRLEYGASELNNGVKLNVRPRAPPSISSEASSRNSQAALLPRRKGSHQKSEASITPRKVNSTRRIFASLGCSGPCLDKGAISIAERSSSGSRSKRVDNFAFPLVKKPSLMVDHDHHDKIFEDPRKSLEVFGSGRMKNRDVAENLAKKISMLTWDAIPKSSAKASTTTIGSTTICDDMTSEASSDLFEIDDISGAGIGYSVEAEYYAPSEASIEWSVVTASAADFSCGRSDYHDEKNVETRPDSGSRKGARARPGGLLGCKSQKAVNVAQTHVHKTKVVERY